MGAPASPYVKLWSKTDKGAVKDQVSLEPGTEPSTPDLMHNTIY